ncbi:MAG: hypothetical protein A2V70_09630 [Planctomycetes bacterium RBG_13_63_9]|nr:MAG: hypothetical protein A2V70_09630 [Planctomycetes bacterium RBG_13_63_9]
MTLIVVSYWLVSISAFTTRPLRVFGGDDLTTVPAYGNINASNTVTGSYWSLADGTTRGNYWTIETSGSTLTIDCLPKAEDPPWAHGSITAVIIERIPEPSTLTLLAAPGLLA